MPRKEVREKYRREGKCTNCGQRNPKGGICGKCRLKNNRDALKVKRKYIEQGRCRECGKDLPTPEDGTITCPSCTLRPRFDRIFQ